MSFLFPVFGVPEKKEGRVVCNLGETRAWVFAEIDQELGYPAVLL